MWRSEEYNGNFLLLRYLQDRLQASVASRDITPRWEVNFASSEYKESRCQASAFAEYIAGLRERSVLVPA